MVLIFSKKKCVDCRHIPARNFSFRYVRLESVVCVAFHRFWHGGQSLHGLPRPSGLWPFRRERPGSLRHLYLLRGPSIYYVNTFLDIYWTLLDIFGHFWTLLTFVVTFGRLWTLVDSCGLLLTLLDSYGHLGTL